MEGRAAGSQASALGQTMIPLSETGLQKEKCGERMRSGEGFLRWWTAGRAVQRAMHLDVELGRSAGWRVHETLG